MRIITTVIETLIHVSSCFGFIEFLAHSAVPSLAF
jgi:hypothetical protein